MALNAYGYCMSTGRRLTSDEMISAAINHTISRHSQHRFVDWEMVRNEEIPYSNVEEFKSLNPECCKVGMVPDNAPPGPDEFLQSVSGNRSDVVNLNFQERTRQPDEKIKSKSVTQQYIITNCGRAWQPW